MVDLKARIKAKLLRRNSSGPSLASTKGSRHDEMNTPGEGECEVEDDAAADLPTTSDASHSSHKTTNGIHSSSPAAANNSSKPRPPSRTSSVKESEQDIPHPTDSVKTNGPTLSSDGAETLATGSSNHPTAKTTTTAATCTPCNDLRTNPSTISTPLPDIHEHNDPAASILRLPTRQQTLIKALLSPGVQVEIQDLDQLLPMPATPGTTSNMPTTLGRKIWVKRPGASATLVPVGEENLVDDVRDMILRKYANSLGRQFDAPDLTLRICPREQTHRLLQPDEVICKTLDLCFPGGQTVEEALLIDVPTRRTPKASPNPRFYGDDRPHESGNDYFPPYPATAPHAHHSNYMPNATIHFPPAMAIVNNSSLPPLPSPGGTRRMGASRPKMQRVHTASPVPTISNGHTQHVPVPGTTNIITHTYSSRPARSRTHSGASSDQASHAAHPHPPPTAPPMPTPPAAERAQTPPPPRVASPRPSARPKKSRKNIEHPTLPAGTLGAGVPPINVLIVEDNPINLKLLEAFVKRLKVRWQTAMNGREAVNKWRAGGFHLVLMDIQLPVMNGLEATREIRRIEKVNSIGVFSASAASAGSPHPEVRPEPDEQDKLSNTEMFKSPVIIVALTASSLQSDRHEALAAGCNDFLTKPVNFVWLERKVMEWGCMQALIDFDGWRKWKDFSQKAAEDESAKKAAAAAAAAKAKANKKNKVTMMPVTAAG